MARPSSLTPLHSLTLASGLVNVMGVVVDFLPPRPTRGTDWQCTFSIADKQSSDEGQRVKMFIKDPNKIPPIRGTGDVVILRNIQLRNYQNSNVLLSNFRTNWVLFHCSDIPEQRPATETPVSSTALRDVAKPTLAEMMMAIDLCNIKARYEWTSTAPAAPEDGDSAAVPVTAPIFEPPQDKFSRVQDIGAGKYHDLVAQVVKMYPVGDRMDLYISDYTENAFLFNYSKEEGDGNEGCPGDEFGYTAHLRKKKTWQGPPGKHTLMVTLFWPHASYASSKVRENDFVLLRNVHIKLGRDGSARLEGALHTDMKYPERVCVQKVSAETDERVKDVLRRKKYFRRAEESRGSSSTGKKRPSEDRTKSQLKRQRRKQRDAGQNGAEEVLSHNAALKPAKSCSPTPVRQRVLLEENKHIACSHPDQPIRTVASINDRSITHAYTAPNNRTIILPFQNLLFRTKVRVVDFSPPDLADFAVRTEEFDCLSDDGSENESGKKPRSFSPSLPSSSASESSQTNSPPPDTDDEVDTRKRWTWFFTLIVEDASSRTTKHETDRMAIHVADEDAEFLLQLTAVNLRRKEDVLVQLREKLFILWGDLEECKTAAIAVGQQLSEQDQSYARPVLAERDRNAPAAALEANANKAPPSKPFTCCVKEYGIQRSGTWQRRFRMFGTSVR